MNKANTYILYSILTNSLCSKAKRFLSIIQLAFHLKNKNNKYKSSYFFSKTIRIIFVFQSKKEVITVINP